MALKKMCITPRRIRGRGDYEFEQLKHELQAWAKLRLCPFNALVIPTIMANLIEIPKHDENKSWEENSPSWRPVVDKDGNRKRPLIQCKCGKNTQIGKHHIHPDGRVTASYFHAKDRMDGCGWHVFIKLLDWSGDEFEPEKLP